MLDVRSISSAPLRGAGGKTPARPVVFPGVFRLFSNEPMLAVQSRGRGRFFLSGSVPEFRDPGLTLESRAGDASVPLAERSTPTDAFRALKRSLPRGVHAHASEAEGGVELQLQETIVPAARLPFAQIFTTDLAQRVRRLDDNSFELLGCTATACLITLKVDARRARLGVHKGASARETARLIGEAVPAGYRAEVDGPIVTIWKDAELHTAAA
jgi:hypothetical protein